MNKSSARQFLQGMIQREPAGDRCSRTPCWQAAKLAKQQQSWEVRTANQMSTYIRTWMYQLHYFASKDSFVLKEVVTAFYVLNPNLPPFGLSSVHK